MGVNYQQFRDLIVRPTLESMKLWSIDAETLLIMTMAHESKGGEYVKQLGNGTALGIYQMEKGTFIDLWNRFISFRPYLYEKIITASDLKVVPFRASPHITKDEIVKDSPRPEEMEGNMFLATAMARIYYLRVEEPIPEDLTEMSIYAKKYWNTEQGKATADNYLSAYLRFIK